jgi:hypothetical protein
VNSHFAKSVGHTLTPKRNTKKFSAEVVNNSFPYITVNLVRQALASFKSFKAPGPDGLQPIVLHHLPDSTLEQLVLIYKACLLLGFTPPCWCYSEVIFIPKPGKDDYSVAKAFRPITLSTFLVKGLERVAGWQLEAGYLRKFPISSLQHGFRFGQSCESALSEVVNFVESNWDSEVLVAGVFLDIQGAFDNVDIKQIIQVMRTGEWIPGL